MHSCAREKLPPIYYIIFNKICQVRGNECIQIGKVCSRLSFALPQLIAAELGESKVGRRKNLDGYAFN